MTGHAAGPLRPRRSDDSVTLRRPINCRLGFNYRRCGEPSRAVARAHQLASSAAQRQRFVRVNKRQTVPMQVPKNEHEQKGQTKNEQRGEIRRKPRRRVLIE